MLCIKDDKPHFNNALLRYVQKGSSSVLQSFFQSDSSTLVDSSGRTLLHYAAESNNISMTQFLIDKKYNLDSLDDDGNTALMLAIQNLNTVMAKLLIEAGADIYLRNAEGKSILSNDYIVFANLHECQKETYHKMVESILQKVRKHYWYDERLFLSRLADIGCSLIQAIHLGDVNVTRLMLENGYAVDKRERGTHETALHEAVYLVDYQNVKVLLEYGADVHALNGNGTSPIYLYDKLSKNTDEKIKILKTLIEHGALLTRPREGHMTPSQNILRNGKLWAINTLMQYDYEWDCRRSLHLLIMNDDPDALEAIRGKNIDLNSTDNVTRSPVLSYAVENGRLTKVQFLLENGADPNIVGGNGYTPFISSFRSYKSTDKKYFLIVRLMLELGANDAQYSFQGNIDKETVFDVARVYNAENLLTPVIAHLAMIESLDISITKLIKRKINSQNTFKNQFEKCKGQLETIKNTIVYESITLYKLLTESQSQITRYARNHEFTKKFKQKMKMQKQRCLVSYYKISLRSRVTKAIDTAELRKEAIIVMDKITGSRTKNNQEILTEIIEYLKSDDLKNICKVFDF